MLDKIFFYAKTILRHQNAPLLPERLQYLNYCQKNGYSLASLKKIADLLLIATEYLPVNSKAPISLSTIKNAATMWRRAVCSDISKFWLRKSREYFISHVVRWLKVIGRLESPVIIDRPFSKYIRQYASYMRNERGLSETTISMRINFAEKFLTYIYSQDTPLQKLKMIDIDDFFAHQYPPAHEYSRYSMSTFTRLLRAFLAYAERYRWCRQGLRDGIIHPRIYKDETIPLSPTRDEVRKLIETTNGKCPKDIRDRAIFMLLAIYGLRCSEIVRLKIDDINCEANIIHVRRAKNSRFQQFPLIESVKKALLRYITEIRPNKTTYQEVFIKMMAPYCPLSSKAISTLIRVKWKLLKIKLKHCGAHSLRYGCATHLINQGVSLKEISDLLGHNNIHSTSTYTKVDLITLRKVADFNIRDLI